MTQLTTAADHDIDAIIRQMDDHGYCIVPGAITSAQADDARHELERLLTAERPPGTPGTPGTTGTDTPRTQRVFHIAVKHPIFLDLMCHPLAVALWKKYLGEDVICSTWSGNTMHPGQSTFDWHADYPYWAMTPPWPAGNFTGQTIWLLDDFTEANGGTGVVPYSHRKLHPPTPAEKRAPRSDLEIVTGVRGSVVFLHGALWHSHRPNTTQSPRSALLGMYIRPFCVPMENMRAQLAQLQKPSDLVKQLLGANQRQPS